MPYYGCPYITISKAHFGILVHDVAMIKHLDPASNVVIFTGTSRARPNPFPNLLHLRRAHPEHQSVDPLLRQQKYHRSTETQTQKGKYKDDVVFFFSFAPTERTDTVHSFGGLESKSVLIYLLPPCWCDGQSQTTFCALCCIQCLLEHASRLSCPFDMVFC